MTSKQNNGINKMNTFLVKLTGSNEWIEIQAESKVDITKWLRSQNKSGVIKSKTDEKPTEMQKDIVMPQVHNKHAKTAPPDAIYIGRPSKWGNPFQIGKDGTREEVVAKHEAWILGNPELLSQIGELTGKHLVCYCSPQACHGDTLMKLANAKMHNKKEDTAMLKGKFVIAGTGTRSLINEPQEYRHKVLNYMVELLRKAKEKHGDNLVVISGMAEGFDEAIARAAVEAGVPFIAAVPNANYINYYWKKSLTGKSRLKQGLNLLKQASEVHYVCKSPASQLPKYKNPDGSDKWGTANYERNEWMVDRANVVWAYNPTGKGGTQHCVNYAKEHDVTVFNIVVPKDDNGGGGETPTTPPVSPVDDISVNPQTTPELEPTKDQPMEKKKNPTIKQWAHNGRVVQLKTTDNAVRITNNQHWYFVVNGDVFYPSKDRQVVTEEAALNWGVEMDWIPGIIKKKEEVKTMGESMTLSNGVVLNPEQAAAFKAITSGTGNVLLTGNAGTGKSFVTELAIKALKNNGKRVAVCATTGIAATHIGGKTYHSALAVLPWLEFEDRVEAVRKKLNKERYEVIIIDEISMMSKQSLEELDLLFRTALGSNKPFAGKRMVFIGDFLQCEPVEKGVPVNLRGFAFESPLWNQAGFTTYQLTTVVRQKAAVFSNFLNAIRRGIWCDEMMEIVDSRMGLETPNEGMLRFKPTNNEADKVNEFELEKLSGETFTYVAQDSLPPYAKPDHWDKQFTTVPRTLNVKIGAQVLHLINDNDHGLVNGDVGTVTEADNFAITVYWHRLNKHTSVVPFEFSQDAPGVYYRKQIPLRVAYAITIHKSQGMTLDMAEMSLSNTFTEGQMYVALSRVRSLDGLYITSFDSNGVTASDKALEFYGLSGNLRGEAARQAYQEINGDGNGGVSTVNPEPKTPNAGPEIKKEEEKKMKVNYKNCFIKLEKLPQDEIDYIVDILEGIVPQLQTDVSNYAIGRQRLWLPYEAPLGNQAFKPGLLHDELWQWIVDNCAKHNFTAQVALISKGGNINPHGDTTYAAPWAMGFNLGKCDWHIQTDRSATRTPAKPSQQDLDNFYQSPTTAHFNFLGGEVFKFDCKHEHAVTNVSPDRWSINVWGIADGPTAQRAGISDRLQAMLDNNPEVQEFILNHTPGASARKIKEQTPINHDPYACQHDPAFANYPSGLCENCYKIYEEETYQSEMEGEAAMEYEYEKYLDRMAEGQQIVDDRNLEPDWDLYTQEQTMTNVIDSFTGEYRWLSNFWGSPIQYGKLLFPTMEHYYQAMKSKNPKDRERIASLAKAGEAKQAGKKLKVRDDWDEIKLGVMEYGLRIKFAKGGSLADKLIATGDMELIEGNTWGDTFWGICNGVGDNNLGKILMQIRADLNNNGGEENAPIEDGDPDGGEEMSEETNNNYGEGALSEAVGVLETCPTFDIWHPNTQVFVARISDMTYDNTYYMRRVDLAETLTAEKRDWYKLGIRYIILDNKTLVFLNKKGSNEVSYPLPDFVGNWFFMEEVTDWNINETDNKRKEMNIKEYLVETNNINTQVVEEFKYERIVTRIITNDPDIWLNKGATVIIKEIDRGSYYYAALNVLFGRESFAVNVTAFNNPLNTLEQEPQLTASVSAIKPKEILFGWADFDSEVMIRTLGYSDSKMSDLSDRGLVVKNSAKMTKRFAEIIRPSRGFKVYKDYTNKKGKVVHKRLNKLVLTHKQMLQAFPNLKTEKIAGVANDGINLIATEVVKDAFRNNPYMTPKEKFNIIKDVEDRKITNLTIRLLSSIGLFKGNTLHNDREIINARLRELNLGDGVTMYDIVTGVDNVKDELATDGSFEILTLEPHHGPGPVKTNDQTLGQYLGIPGIFDVKSLLVNFKHVLVGMEEDLYQGKDIAWMNNINPEPAKNEAEKIASILESSVTSSVTRNVEILHSLGLDIGVSQMMMYMRAQGVIKMHLGKEAVKQRNWEPDRRTNQNWRAKSSEKKAHVYMNHAWRAYIMTKEWIYLAGYDIDLDNTESFYHEETQTFAVCGTTWAKIAPKLGGADLDDEVMIHERRYVRPDGSVNPLVAFILRTPNDWAEFAIVSMSDNGPAFVTEEDMPTIYAKDLAKFKKTGNIGTLPSKKPGAAQRPMPTTWDWSCVYYNYECAAIKGAGVGGQVKTKMLQYSTFDVPFADLVCANEDMIDALQQCKGTIEDLSALNSWSDRAMMKLLTEGHLDSYWWASRNINGTISRLFNLYGFKSAKKAKGKDNSPIVNDLMIPREELVWETYDRMVEYLNSNVKEIPELEIVFKKPIGNKPSDIEMRYRKLVYGLSKNFNVPKDIPEEEVGPFLNDVCVQILKDFKTYIDKNGIEKAYVHILRMARASWLVKRDMPGAALDKWLYSNANDVAYTMLEYFRDAMVWFREREANKNNS